MKQFIPSVKQVFVAVLFVAALIVNAKAQTTVFTNDFNSDNSATWTTTGAIGSSAWSVSRGGDDWGSRINSSQLELSNDVGGTANANGWAMASTALSGFSAPFSSTLSSNTNIVTWTFNMRQIRATPSGFGSTSTYGYAFVLCGTSANANTSGTGYAVTFGTSGYIYLVRYNNGLQGTLTTIASNTTNVGTNYYSLKVEYNPTNNNWSLYARNDGASAFTDPTTGSLTQIGSTTADNTYTGTSMSVMGAYWQGSTAASQTAFADNISVVVSASSCTTPSTQPNTFSSNTITPTSANIAFTRGNGDGGVLVIARAASAVATNPLSGNAYTANSTYASGNAIGSGFVIFNGTAAGVSAASGNIPVSGLSPNTTYHFAAYEYNSTGTCYNTTSPLTGSFTTLNPTINVTGSAMDFGSQVTGTISAEDNYTISASNLSANLVITPPAGYEVSTDPNDNYQTSLTLTPSGGTIGSTIIYVRFSPSSASGLTSGNITHASTNATTQNLSVTGYGITTAPTVQATFTSFISPGETSFTLNFAAGTGGAGRLVVVRPTSAVNFTPVDATAYTANTSFTSGSALGPNTDCKVVFAGSGTSATVTNLTANTVYHVAVFEYNGSSTTINYLETGSATSSRTTLIAEPSGNPGTASFANNTTTAFDVSWTAASPVPTGYLVMRYAGASIPDNPVDGTLHALNDIVGSSTVVYVGTALTLAQTLLNVGSEYRYKVFSYDGTGANVNYRTTSVSTGTTFTRSNEPAAHAASFTSTSNSVTSTTLNFSASSTISAGGYLVLSKSTAFSGADYPTDGNSYSNGATIGGAAVVGTVTNNATTSLAATTTADATFNFLLVPFNWDGTNATTRNYYTAATIPTTAITTPSGAADVVAVSSSEATTISSTENTSTITTNSQGVQVWQFTIRDGGAASDNDALPTIVSSITLSQSAGNGIDNFSNAIQNIALFNGSTLISNSATINASTIVFSGLNLTIADNSSTTLSLRISVKANVNGGTSTGVNADGDDFGFAITNANFTTDGLTTSSQKTTFTQQSSLNGQNVYSVAATKLAYVQQPTNVLTFTNISPAVTVEGLDAGNNRDLGFTASVSVTATGATLSGSPVSVNAVSGLATYSSLQFTTAATGVTLTANSSGLTGITSNSIDVTTGAGSYVYRTLRSGNWNEVSSGNETWERSTDGNTWSTVTVSGDLPSNASSTITILNAHTITVSAAVTADELTVSSGGQLTVNSGITLTIANGTGTDLTVAGTLNNAGTITLSSSTVSFSANGLYQHAQNGGTIITATWDATATCEITGATSTAPGGLAQNFGNFTWNCASQSANLNLSGNLTTVNGNLVVSSTGGTTELRFTGSSALTLTIAGNLTIADDINWDNNATGTTTVNLGGNFSFTAGDLESSGAVTTINFTGANKTFTHSGGNFIGTNIEWGVNNGASLTLVNSLPVTTGRTLTVNGTLNTATLAVTGAGAFTLNATGVLGLGSTSGLSTTASTGNIQVTGTRTYNAAATFDYNGSGAQATGNGLPATVANLTINNTAGVTLGSATTLTAILTLTNGVFNANSNLTLNTTSSIVYGAGSITNYTLPSEINNFTPPSGTTVVGANLQVNGVLDLGSNILDIGNNILTIAGDVTRTTGTIKSNSGTINISGSALDETLFFDQTTPGTTNKLASLTINRASSIITMGNAVSITGTLTPTNGTLASDGNLTIASSITGSGRIAQIGAGADITGNVNIQRWVIGGAGMRNWRTMSSPVSGFAYSALADDIFISGPGGSTNGFDASGSGSSIMVYEENPSNTRGWKSIASTSETLTAGMGMLVYYRGDRTQTSALTNNTIDPNSMAVDYSGTINKGTLSTINLSYNSTGTPANDGWNFLGNPYPSEINYDMIDKTGNVSSTYYVFNPITGNYVNRDPSLNEHIAIGQGFFVQVDAGAQTVTFEEDDKVATSPTAYFKTQQLPFAVKMFQDSTRYDVAWLNFVAGASKQYVFNQDAMKFMNSRINVAFKTTNNQLAQRNKVPILLTNTSDTFDIYTNSTVTGNYWLAFEELGAVPANKNIFLVDAYTNSWINLRSTTSYAYQINTTNAATFGSRFKLIITDVYSALPVKLVSFTAQRLNEQNVLTWKTASEKNTSHFEVQQSTDGVTFKNIDIVKATNSASGAVYTFNDKTNIGKVYYRLNIVGNKGVEQNLSQVVVINANDKLQLTTTVYPNPTNGIITIVANTNEPLNQVSIYNYAGKLVNQIQTNNSSVQFDLSDLASGVYLLQTANGQSIKLVKE